MLSASFDSTGLTGSVNAREWTASARTLILRCGSSVDSTMTRFPAANRHTCHTSELSSGLLMTVICTYSPIEDDMVGGLRLRDLGGLRLRVNDYL